MDAEQVFAVICPKTGNLLHVAVKFTDSSAAGMDSWTSPAGRPASKRTDLLAVANWNSRLMLSCFLAVHQSEVRLLRTIDKTPVIGVQEQQVMEQVLLSRVLAVEQRCGCRKGSKRSKLPECPLALFGGNTTASRLVFMFPCMLFWQQHRCFTARKRHSMNCCSMTCCAIGAYNVGSHHYF